MLLYLVLLVAGGGGHHQGGHNTVGSGAGCTGSFVDVAVSHWHHALADVPLGADQDDVELKSVRSGIIRSNKKAGAPVVTSSSQSGEK